MIDRSSLKFSPVFTRTFSHSGRRCGRGASAPGARCIGVPRLRSRSIDSRVLIVGMTVCGGN
jgi:hypothetical protein